MYAGGTTKIAFLAGIGILSLQSEIGDYNCLNMDPYRGLDFDQSTRVARVVPGTTSTGMYMAFRRDQGLIGPQSRATHMASPMPPPMHIVASPLVASRFFIS